MATLLLTVGAAALTQGMGAWLALGIKAAAVVAGSFIDNRLFGSTVTQEGPRLDNLQVQASTEGAALPEIAGRARIAGQIIWATRFREVVKTEESGGKGGGGPKVKTTTYTYFVNFAVGLCEGPIDRVGRIWADGKPLDMTNVVMRVYRGTADQMPDPFIEGVEGAANVPAYRGTAYVVFEDFALEKFGNRIPQLNFEVFRRVSSADSVETLVEAISVIPGGGERVYDTTVHTLTRAQETDLPDVVSITFIDGAGEYGSGAISASRLAGFSDRKADASFALVTDDVQAQGIADRALAEAWIGRETAKLALSPALVALDPGDVIDLTVNGRSRSFRITRISDAGAREIEAQRAEAAIYAPALPGAKLPIIEVPPVHGAAVLAIMDLPMLHDTDVPWAPHVAATASPFGGVALLDSATGSGFALDTVLPIRATMGETLSPFYSGPTEYWDRRNVLSAKLYAGVLESRSEDDVLAGGANALAVANPDGDWEIVQFADASLTGPGTYDLSMLLRGRLGTEHAMRFPLAAGARVVLLDGALAQLQASLSERGQPRFYAYGPPDLAPNDPAWRQTTFTLHAVGLTPWSPVHVRGERNGSGDLTITWVRRTRFGGIWADGADVPLNEESERYEIDILGGASVVRTIASTTPSAIYTAAQQAADFGAP